MYWLLVFCYISVYCQETTLKTPPKRNLEPFQCHGGGGAGSSKAPSALTSSECCDATMPTLMRESLLETQSNALGQRARVLQLALQRLFQRSYEVVLSNSEEFVVSTYSSGRSLCRIQVHGLTAVAYESPVQYNISDVQNEVKMASVDFYDALGWKSPIDEEMLVVDDKAQHKQHDVTTEAVETTVSASACEHRMEGAYSGSTPLNISTVECCDSRLLDNMRQSIAYFSSTPRLADAAHFMQRRAEAAFNESFEVIVSHEDFVLSSYYHGLHTCKLYDGQYFYLAYATPEQYDWRNTVLENLLATIDYRDPLGSSALIQEQGNQAAAAFQAPLQEVQAIPLPQQPQLLPLPQGPTQIQAPLASQALPAPMGLVPLQGAPPPSPQVIPVQPLAGQALSVQPIEGQASTDQPIAEESSSPAALGETLPESPPQAAPVQGADVFSGGIFPARDLPPGTQCSDDRSFAGSRCCDARLFDTASGVIDDLSTSPMFGRQSVSVMATLIQKRIQQRLQRSYEVMVSAGDMSVATHTIGDNFCKYSEHGLTVIAYETPRQYNYDSPMDSDFGRISDPEPLGSSATSLPGMREQHTPVPTSDLGTPVESHCSPNRGGNRCCNAGLFNSIQQSIVQAQSQPNFDPFDWRAISRQIQSNAETRFQRSMEVIVSPSDFQLSTYQQGDMICKFQIDKYYVMAWETPEPYPIHTDFGEDRGMTAKPQCPPNDMGGLEGTACCNGFLYDQMGRTVDYVTGQPGFDRNNLDAVATQVHRNVQRRFNATYETIVSRADFVWRPSAFNPSMCKVDIDGYHILVWKSGDFAPPVQDFLDPVPLQSFVAAQPVAQPEVPVQQAVPVFQQAVVQQPPVQYQYYQPYQPYQYYYPTPSVACFSTDTWMTTPQGKKNMAQVKVGDFVLTANRTHTYFTPIQMWMHREPNVRRKFVTIMTEYGKTLALTSKHLIFRHICDEDYAEYVDELPSNREAVYAEELNVGDCMFVLHRGKFRQQRLMRITITERKGIYAPLTANGRIVVNDMVASCYSEVKEPTLQTTFFSAVAFVRETLERSMQMLSTASSTVKVPWATDLTMQLLKIVVPFEF